MGDVHLTIDGAAPEWVEAVERVRDIEGQIKAKMAQLRDLHAAHLAGRQRARAARGRPPQDRRRWIRKFRGWGWGGGMLKWRCTGLVRVLSDTFSALSLWFISGLSPFLSLLGLTPWFCWIWFSSH